MLDLLLFYIFALVYSIIVTALFFTKKEIFSQYFFLQLFDEITGPRSCPGKQMGKMQYFLFMVAILQQFKIIQIGKDSIIDGVTASEDVKESGLVLSPASVARYKFAER